MKKLILIIFTFLYADISNYKPVFYCINTNEAVIRTFKSGNIKKMLTVNLSALKTEK